MNGWWLVSLLLVCVLFGNGWILIKLDRMLGELRSSHQRSTRGPAR